MAKRRPTSEVNQDNWFEEDEPEDAGTFKRATADEIKGRVIKTARRRGIGPGSAVGEKSDEGVTKSVFSGFAGFGQKPDVIAPPKQVFSFLSNPSNQNGKTPASEMPSMSPAQASKNINGLQASASTVSSSSPSTHVPATSATTSSSNSSSSSNSNTSSIPNDNSDTNSDKEYFRKLKGLNESVSKWISSHVESNPLCILTPVFHDYEKHLATIQSARYKGETKPGDIGMDNNTSKEKPASNVRETVKGSALEEVTTVTSDANEDKPTFTSSIFGSSGSNNSTASATFSFGTSSVSPPKPSMFSFGSSSAGNTQTKPTFSFGAGNATSPSAGFSFGAGKPFTFGNVSKPDTGEDNQNAGEESEEPPKPDHKPVSEEGAVYTKRCKVFQKKEEGYTDRGVGTLFLKPVDGGKTQLIVRADTSLGNVLINVLLSSSLPTQRIGTNNVAIVCIPTPEVQKPVTVLLRVKTDKDADELLETLEKYKK